jgi:predicted GNAT family acetyltransferase
MPPPKFLAQPNAERLPHMPVYHITPGEPPIEALTTFGISAKNDSESAIGQFGTGFKYAVAGILRYGGRIELFTPTTNYLFTIRAVEVRGKRFNMVVLAQEGKAPRDLGFTTDLGKHWEPWMWFRELESNTQDEGGWTTDTFPGVFKGSCLKITSRSYKDAHASRNEVFLGSQPLFAFGGCEIHRHNGYKHMYYKGVRVGSSFVDGATLNFSQGIRLTEDRTVQEDYTAKLYMRQALDNAPEEIVKPLILANVDNSAFPINEWNETLIKLYNAHEVSLATYHGQRVANYIRRTSPPKTVTVEGMDEDVLEAALAKARRMGYRIFRQDVTIADLGAEVLGSVTERQIFLSPRVFSIGEDMVLQTLLEEHFHSVSGHSDQTRAFQNYLIEQVIRQYDRSK